MAGVNESERPVMVVAVTLLAVGSGVVVVVVIAAVAAEQGVGRVSVCDLSSAHCMYEV